MENAGFFHNRVDDGEGAAAHHKMTPILVADGTFDRERIMPLFKRQSERIEPEIAQFVVRRLMEYPGERPGRTDHDNAR